MKVKIGETVYDSEKEPIMLVFESDKQRTNFIDNILKMEPKDGVRKYVEFPDNIEVEQVKNFMKL